MTSPTELERLLPVVRKAWHTKIQAKPSITQKQDRTDKPVKGPIWVSRCQIPPPPEHDLEQLVLDTIKELSTSPSEHTQYDLQNATRIDNSEWLGARHDSTSSASEPQITEEEKFELMSREVSEDSPVVLFLHGGNMTFGGPVLYRRVLHRLAQLGGLRCFTPAYRLAPQHPFPAALIDALHAYLYLLAPPPGSFHKPIPASKIIFAGESAGCSLVFAMIRLLLHVARQGSATVRYHGQSVSLPLPAGVTALSPYLDFTVSLPSERLYQDTDVFVKTLLNPVNDPPEYDQEADWPSNPPRHDFYSSLHTLDHELVSPVAVTDWQGAPPMWICAGGHERPVDCARVVAQRAYESGVNVQYEEYEQMPHTWFAFLPKLPATNKCFDNWARAVRSITSGSLASRAVAIDPWTVQETAKQMNHLVPFPLDHVSKYMRAEKLNRRPVVVRPANPRL